MGNEASRAKGRVVAVGGRTVKVRSLLAEGGFSFVFIVTDTYTRELLVLKRMRIVADNEEALALAHRELALAETLPPHPHVIRFIAGVWRDGQAPPPGPSGSGGDGPGLVEVDLLLEYAAGGTAMAEVAAFRARGERLPEARVLRRWRDLVAGVAHLHAQAPPIAHRDIKLENLLLVPARASGVGALGALDGGVGASAPMAGSVTALADSDGRCFVGKLADFGSAWPGDVPLRSDAEIADAEAAIERTTTPAFRAPELVDVRRFAHAERAARVLRGPSADVWALGVALYQLAFGVTPFEDVATGVPSRIAIANAKYALPPRGAAPYSPGLHALIAACLAPRPEDRPTAAALLQRGGALSQWPRDDAAFAAPVAAPQQSAARAAAAAAPASTAVNPLSSSRPAGGGRPALASALSRQPAPNSAAAASSPVETSWSSDLAAAGITFSSDAPRAAESGHDFAPDWGDAGGGGAAAAPPARAPANGFDDDGDGDLMPYGVGADSGGWPSGSAGGSGSAGDGGAKPAGALMARAARRALNGAAGAAATAAGLIGSTVSGVRSGIASMRGASGGSGAAAPVPAPGDGEGVGGGGRRAGALVEQLETRVLQLMGGEDNSVRRWVVKATSLAAGPPKAKYVRRLVLHGYEVEDAAARGGGGDATVYTQLAQRPMGEPVVALKACGLLLRLWALGPPSALPASAPAVAALEAAAAAAPPAAADAFSLFVAAVMRATVAKARLFGVPAGRAMPGSGGGWAGSDARYGLERISGGAARALASARRGAAGGEAAVVAAYAATLAAPGIAPPLTSAIASRGSGSGGVALLEELLTVVTAVTAAVAAAWDVPGMAAILRASAAYAVAPEGGWGCDAAAAAAAPRPAALYSAAGALPTLAAEAADGLQASTVVALLLLASAGAAPSGPLAAAISRVRAVAVNSRLGDAIDAAPALSDHPALRGHLDAVPALPQRPRPGSPAADAFTARLSAAEYLAATAGVDLQRAVRGGSGAAAPSARPVVPPSSGSSHRSLGAAAPKTDALFASADSDDAWAPHRGITSAASSPSSSGRIAASTGQPRQMRPPPVAAAPQPRDDAAVDVAGGLTSIRRTPGNESCAECGARVGASAWASVNLGLVFCLRCSGVHRNLGVHITQVRSLSLDTWKPAWIRRVLAVGNARGARYWEAALRDAGAAAAAGKPTPASAMADVVRWCRAKYEARQWAPAGQPSPDEALDAGGDGSGSPAPAPAPPPRAAAAMTTAAGAARAGGAPASAVPTAPAARRAAPVEAEFDPWGTPAGGARLRPAAASAAASPSRPPWVDPWASESPQLAAAAAAASGDWAGAGVGTTAASAAGAWGDADVSFGAPRDGDADGGEGDPDDGSGSDGDDAGVERIESLRADRLQAALRAAAAVAAPAPAVRPPAVAATAAAAAGGGSAAWASEEDIMGAFATANSA